VAARRPADIVARVSVDEAEFRRAVGRFATGVTVVATLHDGAEHAMTVNSFTSVSLTPVLVLVCVEKVARLHEPLLASAVWSVSVLGVDHRSAGEWFATRGRPEDHRLVGYRTRPGPVTGSPVFVDALAALECRTWARYDGGDHTIVVGEVAWVDPGSGDGRPLIYYGGEYGELPAG